VIVGLGRSHPIRQAPITQELEESFSLMIHRRSRSTTCYLMTLFASQQYFRCNRHADSSSTSEVCIADDLSFLDDLWKRSFKFFRVGIYTQSKSIPNASALASFVDRSLPDSREDSRVRPARSNLRHTKLGAREMPTSKPKFRPAGAHGLQENYLFDPLDEGHDREPMVAL